MSGEVAGVTIPSAAHDDGLSTPQAQATLAADGPNTVTSAAPRRIPLRILRQMADPFVVLLLAALVVTVAVGDVADSVIIALGVSQTAGRRHRAS
jgi:Ca2+-transporting ATPase